LGIPAIEGASRWLEANALTAASALSARTQAWTGVLDNLIDVTSVVKVLEWAQTTCAAAGRRWLSTANKFSWMRRSG